MRFLLTICSLLLASNSFAGKVVMEGISSSAYTIMVDTTNNKVGISTGSPQFTLDVNGSAYIRGITSGTFVGNIAGQASSVPPGGVDLSTITTAIQAAYVMASTGTTAALAAAQSAAVSASTGSTAAIALANAANVAATTGTTAALAAAQQAAVSAATGTTAALGASQAAAVMASTETAARIAADAQKQNSFVGITSACAAGQYMSSGTWDNGVLVGGGCSVAGAGGGLSGLTVGALQYADSAASLAASQIIRDGATSLTIAGSSVTATSGNFTTASATTTFSGYVDIGVVEKSASCPNSASCTALCQPGTRVITGSCYSSEIIKYQGRNNGTAIGNSGEGWVCVANGTAASLGADALCARIK